MNNNIKKYKELIILIQDNIKNKHDKFYLSNNIEILSTKFNDLSNIISTISNIIFNKKLSTNKKINMITDYLPFNKSQSNQLITNFLKNKNNVKINNNIQTAGFFFDTKKIFNFKFKKNKDFKKPLDIIYILLFILASYPFAYGAIADFIIICKALIDGRYFLATMVSITLFFSWFTLWHIVDLGLIFKVLYALDNHSYINYSKKNNKNIVNNNNYNENDFK